MNKGDNISRVTVCCQFCGKLFLMVRPLFINERDRATCPACRAEAEKNTNEMVKRNREEARQA